MKLLPSCESHKVPHDEVVDAIETECKANSELKESEVFLIGKTLVTCVGESSVPRS
jgi:hypothetical protein